MRKVVTVQAKTVEEATTQALEMIALPLEKVTVEVISNPSKRLLGFRKGLAEVVVSEIVQQVKPQNEELDELEKIVTDLIVGDDDSSKVGIETIDQDTEYGVKVTDGKIEFLFKDDEFPVLLPTEKVILFKNGVQIIDSTKIEPTDDISITVQDEIIPTQFSVSLIEQNMIALVTITPGKKITRRLADTSFKKYLRLETIESVELFNDLKPQQIVDELKTMNVQQGIDFRAVQKATEVVKPYELIVAKGVLPVEGTDGDLEVHIEYEEFNPDSLEKVDYREMNKITNVQQGQVIATHIVPTAGIEGKSLLGKVVPVKKVSDIRLQLGKNIVLEGENIVATISGKPSLEWRGKFVKVEVNHELHHPGEVDLESGNIRFEGDVRIGGNILPSMFVGATGSIFIGGSVSKATVHVVKEAIIQGNVLSSTITVGEQSVIVREAVQKLQRIIPQLEQIKQAVEQVFLIRGESEDQLDASQLKRLIYLLIEKKYTNFEMYIKDLIQTIKENEDELSEEWLALASTFYDAFVNPLNEDLESITNFETIIEDAMMLIQMYGQSSVTQSTLVLPYAINSYLYCNGTIQVTTKGVYHTNLIAENNIIIQGVCRGGEIRANNNIVLHETGSENPVKTVVKTSESGSIKIGKAYVGTEIHVGNRKYSCSVDEVGVYARLNDEGELIIR